MKRILYLSLIFIGMLTACTTNRQQTDYDQPWNTPTLNGIDSINGMWGMASVFEDDGVTSIPAIPNLYHNSFLCYCKADTCWGVRLFLAVRCPEDKVLLRWMEQHINGQCYGTQIGYQFDDDKELTHAQHFKDAKQICDHYIMEAKSNYENVPCHQDPYEHGIPLEQNGIIITDVWQRGDVCTFFESRWFDFHSCGDNTKKTYYSVDKKSGKVLNQEDLVEVSDTVALRKLIYKHLDHETLLSCEELPTIDGCALIREGLVFFYYPYELGCGADGQYYSVVPYEELEKNGFKMKR